MTTFLLDANVLIALVVAEHDHHDAASTWLAEVDEFAVCPIVEGALVRFLLRIGEAPATATAILAGVHANPLCQFWPDAVSFRDVDLSDLSGHRQVTDSYLSALARSNGGRLVTFDRALATRDESVLLLSSPA